MVKRRRKGAGRKPLTARQLHMRGAKRGRIQKADRRERASAALPRTDGTTKTRALDVAALRKIPAEQIAEWLVELKSARGPKRLQVDRSLRGWFVIAHRCGLLTTPADDFPPAAAPESFPPNTFDDEFDDEQ